MVSAIMEPEVDEAFERLVARWTDFLATWRRAVVEDRVEGLEDLMIVTGWSPDDLEHDRQVFVKIAKAEQQVADQGRQETEWRGAVKQAEADLQAAQRAFEEARDRRASLQGRIDALAIGRGQLPFEKAKHPRIWGDADKVARRLAKFGIKVLEHDASVAGLPPRLMAPTR